MSPGCIRRRPVPDCLAPLHENALIHRVLAARGVVSADELSVALAGLPGSDTLPGIDAAIRRLLKARDSSERILIVGDYDCDGATSTAVAMLGLRGLGFTALDYFIPNRFVHGYGLSPAIVDIACERGSSLILTVDNGVASVDGVDQANRIGIDVVITDHHLPPTVLPAAAALVNPNLAGSVFPGRCLAGVGVMFYVLLALRAAIVRRSGLQVGDSTGSPTGSSADDTARQSADSAACRYKLAPLLDLVAIGTVADVVPLDRINRTLVEQGLRRIRAGHGRLGVKALLAVAGREAEHLSTTDIGFSIGPRLNAAGRIDEMRTGVRCLLADDPVEAHSLACQLDGLNQKRRRIEAGMRDEADHQLAELALEPASVQDHFGIALFDERWHQGVIGILAGRLKEHLHRPVAVFTGDDAGDSQGASGPLIKGSVRSIAEVHVRDVIDTIAVANPGLVLRFGGHAMAAGLTIERAGFDRFASAFDSTVRDCLAGQAPAREWWVDGALAAHECHLQNALLLERLVPWGQGFETPLFAGEFVARQVREVGKGHLKLCLQSVSIARGADTGVTEMKPLHAGPMSSPLDAIAFNPTLPVAPGQHLHIVYALGVNRYRGNTALQLEVKHMEPA